MAPTVLYAGLLSIFTSGQLVLFSVGIDPSGADVLNREAQASVIRAAVFYMVAYCFFCAACVATNEIAGARPARYRAGPSLDDWRTALRSTGAVCIVVGAVPFMVANLHNFRVILTEGYSGYYAEGARISSPLLNLSYLFIVGLVFIGCGGVESHRKWAALALASVAILRLAAGDRGEGMIYLLTAYLVGTQLARVGKGRRLKLILVFIFAIIAIPAVGVIRQSFGGVGVGLLDSIREQNPFETTLQTTGGTLFPLVKIMELIPAAEPFAAGGTYVSSVAHLFPGFLRGPLTDIAADTGFSSPATWLMERMGMSYGPGFTPFAEAYMNFSWIGGCGAMFVYGVLFTTLLRVPTQVSSAGPLRVALVIASFALVGFSVRGSVNFVVPFLFRYVLVPGVAVALIAQGLRRSRGRKVGHGD
ncbi:O-antigen polysaccharide polymerase Wzy [Rhodococcus sp. X156]|uniref:O-antigen polysaccharide polymerase Wzy n=1 Tax=Rhodococcus sp. X156 TaxID=2499145 RepID=UPI0013E2DB0C|nr:O-antigen polysaccharide polymerase Wzy [Rhodococcus sp. X156]